MSGKAGGRCDKTWKYAAAIREMAALGLSGVEIGRLLHIGNRVHSYGNIFGVRFLADRGEPKLVRAVRAGYACGLSPALIAAQTHSTIGSVKTTASRLGLTADAVRDPGKHRRGFQVPADRMAEYKDLRKLGLTLKECGYAMGLLERPAARIPIHVSDAHKFQNAEA